MSSVLDRHFVYTQPGTLRLYSTAELLRLPPVHYMVAGAIPENGLAGIYGPPGGGKSFVAIHTAMCVGTGLAWFGRPVDAGFALYVSAEGGSGVGKRVGGWCQHFGVNPSHAHVAWITEAITVQEDTETMERLFHRIQNEVREHPTMIIIDTLARCFDGNENAQEDMGRFVKGVDALRTAFGCTVVVVHHTREDGSRERGSTAFRGAADAMIQVIGHSGNPEVRLVCDKQKDEEAFTDITLRLKVIDVLNLPHATEAIRTCVLVDDTAEKAGVVEDILATLSSTEGTTYSQLEVLARGQGVSPATLKRRLKSLLEAGKITRAEGVYSIRG